MSRRSRCAKLPGSTEAQFTEFIDVEPVHHLQCVEHWCQMQGMRSMMSVHTAIELPCHWQHQLRVVSVLAFSLSQHSIGTHFTCGAKSIFMYMKDNLDGFHRLIVMYDIGREEFFK